MKFCSKCGKEMVDEATICINCGCSTVSPDPSVAAVKVKGPKEPFSSKQSIPAIIMAGIGVAWPFVGILFGLLLNFILGVFLSSVVSAFLCIACISLSVVGLITSVKARKIGNTDTLTFIAMIVAIAGIVVGAVIALLHVIVAVISFIPFVINIICTLILLGCCVIYIVIVVIVMIFMLIGMLLV